MDFEALREKHHKELTAKHYVGIDLETTGFSPDKFAEIIEFAAFRVSDPNPKEWEVLYSLIKPKARVPKKITKLTGITQEQVDQAPGFTHFAKELYTFVSEGYIVAHNAKFEKRFLDFYMNYNQLLFDNPYIDTVEIYKTAFPGRKNYKLDSFLDEFGLVNEEWHTAKSDAYYTTVAFMKLREAYLDHFGMDDPIDYDFEDRLYDPEVWQVKSANYWSKSLHTKNPKERLYVRLVNDKKDLFANVYYDYIVGDWDYNNSITRVPLDFSEIEKGVCQMRRVSSLDELRPIERQEKKVEINF